jgi:hypothetical protein
MPIYRQPTVGFVVRWDYGPAAKPGVVTLST